ncbi:MAG: FAD-binding protein [Desulfarculaceae bacterium]|nr:FAD-binding protein [Desulfarculaceae bacterium]MCF8071160.1 FAD-binding protein [Desulfarculaceae bacterium]MCF8101237.1 FAD-binding protein [Desulfarculaceae bacterium]MCF8115214.1 FAD-binding protein [Desulfarculaceae bacterium]
MRPETKDQLRSIVGEANFSDQLIDLVSYSSDASEHAHRPQAAVWADSAEEIQAIVGLANAEGFPVTVRGAGTGLSGLSVPAQGGLVLDLGRMDKILDISIGDRVAVVQPGVVYASLEKALAPHGYVFPPDPASGKACTLGGNVGTNAGGVKGAKYGTTRDYVLGLSVVLGDGRLMKTGNRAMKSVSGFDLTRLFVGSEGALGIVTEIILKISPKPLATATTLAIFDDLEDAGRAVSGVMASGVIPSVLEILGRETLKAINQNTELNLPEVDAMLLAETDGYTQGEADYQMERVVEQFSAHNAREVKRAESASQAAELWKARKSCYAVLARLRPNFTLEDITVPMSQVAPMLRGVQDIAARHQVQIATFGHAGDGNLHPQFLYDGADQDERGRVEAAAGDLFQLAVDLGGTLTGEHGIGLSKAAYMTLEHDPVAMDLMRSIKKVCDPNNILNPGKMALDV